MCECGGSGCLLQFVGKVKYLTWFSDSIAVSHLNFPFYLVCSEKNNVFTCVGSVIYVCSILLLFYACVKASIY